MSRVAILLGICLFLLIPGGFMYLLMFDPFRGWVWP